jgi:hypothetical protein
MDGHGMNKIRPSASDLEGTIHMNARRTVQALPVVALLLATGCVARVVYYDPPPPPPVMVPEGPPPPAVVVAPSPGPEYVWVTGVWEWQGRWVWVDGRWLARPHPYAVWVTPRWTRHGRGYVWMHGHWR